MYVYIIAFVLTKMAKWQILVSEKVRRKRISKEGIKLQPTHKARSGSWQALPLKYVLYMCLAVYIYLCACKY